MNEMVVLKDAREVVIRALAEADLPGLHRFFAELPEEDRIFLRMDVTDHEQVERRLRETREGKAFRLVALDGESIAAYGVLELEGHGWQEHVGELRLIVGRAWQRAGLGMNLARELYLLAVQERVEEIVARMMGPQRGARRILQRLGFKEEVVLPDHVKDRKGRLQDLVVMRCKLQTLLQEMKHHFQEFDWQRGR